jgi:hypothetical protein
MLRHRRSRAVGETLDRAERAGCIPVAVVTRRRHDEPMCTDAPPNRVWVEVDASAEPIAGLVHRGAAPARPFAGWLELVALLESERGPAIDQGAARERP